MRKSPLCTTLIKLYNKCSQIDNLLKNDLFYILMEIYGYKTEHTHIQHDTRIMNVISYKDKHQDDFSLCYITMFSILI